MSAARTAAWGADAGRVSVGKHGCRGLQQLAALTASRTCCSCIVHGDQLLALGPRLPHGSHAPHLRADNSDGVGAQQPAQPGTGPDSQGSTTHLLCRPVEAVFVLDRHCVHPWVAHLYGRLLAVRLLAMCVCCSCVCFTCVLCFGSARGSLFPRGDRRNAPITSKKPRTKMIQNSTAARNWSENSTNLKR
jgi:hypothetical protein